VIELSEIQAALIRNGQQIETKKIENIHGMVRMYNEQVFLGLGEMLLNGKLIPKRIFNLM
ncbi:MAG: tRNA pseudouridine(55) synthase TruB, partial [Cocleimonas sp.]